MSDTPAATPVLVETPLVSASPAMPAELAWPEWKRQTCEVIVLGLKELAGDAALKWKTVLDADLGPDIKIVAEENPCAWDDTKRLAGSVLAAGLMQDVYPASAKDLCASTTHREMHAAQALGVSNGDTRYNASTRMVRAGLVMVYVDTGKDVAAEDRLVPLCSARYYNALGAYWEKAKGRINGSSAATLRNEAGEDEDEVCGPLKHPFAKYFARLHADAGIGPDTPLECYTRMYVVPDEEDFVVVSEPYNHHTIKIAHTSAYQFAMDYGKPGAPAVRKAAGVWSPNTQGSGVQMSAIRLTASTTDYDLAGVAAMASAPAGDEPEPERTEDDAGRPDAGPYPFAGPDGRLQQKYKGTYLAHFTLPLRTIYKESTRGGECISKGAGGGGLTRGLTRGATRGCGGRTAAPPPQCELAFAKMATGVRVRDVEDMPDIDTTAVRLERPSMTIMDLIVRRGGGGGGGLTLEEKEAKGVVLVKTIAAQMRGHEEMFVSLASAPMTGIQESAGLLHKPSAAEQGALNDSASYMMQAGDFEWGAGAKKCKC